MTIEALIQKIATLNESIDIVADYPETANEILLDLKTECEKRLDFLLNKIKKKEKSSKTQSDYNDEIKQGIYNVVMRAVRNASHEELFGDISLYIENEIYKHRPLYWREFDVHCNAIISKVLECEVIAEKQKRMKLF